MSYPKSWRELVEAKNASTHAGSPPNNDDLGEGGAAQGSSPLPHQLNLSSPSFVRSDRHEPNELPPSSPSADFRWRLSRRDRSSTPSDPDIDPFADNASDADFDQAFDADGEDEDGDHDLDPNSSPPLAGLNKATWLDGSGSYRLHYAKDDDIVEGYNNHEASNTDKGQSSSRALPYDRMGEFEHVNGYADNFASSPPHYPDVRSPRPPMGRVRSFAATEQAREKDDREREEADMKYQLQQKRMHYGEVPQSHRSNYGPRSVRDNNDDQNKVYRLDDHDARVRKGRHSDRPNRAVEKERSSSPRSRDYERQKNRHRPHEYPVANHYRSREATPPPQDTQRHGLSDSSPHTPSSTSALTNTVKDNMTNTMEVRVKNTTPMKKVMEAWKAKRRVQGDLRFLFDGERVTEDATCESMGMGEGDVIEVFTEQLGGR